MCPSVSSLTSINKGTTASFTLEYLSRVSNDKHASYKKYQQLKSHNIHVFLFFLHVLLLHDMNIYIFFYLYFMCVYIYLSVSDILKCALEARLKTWRKRIEISLKLQYKWTIPSCCHYRKLAMPDGCALVYHVTSIKWMYKYIYMDFLCENKHLLYRIIYGFLYNINTIMCLRWVF